jgi:hypothetical protein
MLLNLEMILEQNVSKKQIKKRDTQSNGYRDCEFALRTNTIMQSKWKYKSEWGKDRCG